MKKKRENNRKLEGNCDFSSNNNVDKHLFVKWKHIQRAPSKHIDSISVG